MRKEDILHVVHASPVVGLSQLGVSFYIYFKSAFSYKSVLIWCFYPREDSVLYYKLSLKKNIVFLPQLHFPSMNKMHNLDHLKTGDSLQPIWKKYRNIAVITTYFWWQWTKQFLQEKRFEKYSDKNK